MARPSPTPTLAQDNPMTWLQQKPRNYAGEYYDPTPGAVAPGHWMFDLKSRDLIYVVQCHHRRARTVRNGYVFAVVITKFLSAPLQTLPQH
jgi:hypothetical protein